MEQTATRTRLITKSQKTYCAPNLPLNSCDLLIPVLECYMTREIRRTERDEKKRMSDTGSLGRSVPEASVFHALQAPLITPVEYLRRLARYSYCSRSVFVAAFFYLERIGGMGGVELRINSLCVHRLLLTAVLLATKVIDDVLYDNAHFAKVGGLDVSELNMLELDMLKVLDFRLHIEPDDFEMFEGRLLETALASTDAEYGILAERLRNLGYDGRRWRPASPGSTMDVCFSTQ